MNMMSNDRFNLALATLLGSIRFSQNYSWQEPLVSGYHNGRIEDIPALAYPLRTESDPACVHLSCPAGEIARYPVLIPLFRHHSCLPNPLECMCMPPDHNCTDDEHRGMGLFCEGKGVCITRGNPICKASYDRLSNFTEIANKLHVCYTPGPDACRKLHDFDFRGAGNFFYVKLNEPCQWSIDWDSYADRSIRIGKRLPKRTQLERAPYLAESHGGTYIYRNTTCKSGNHCEARPGQTCSMDSESYGDGSWTEYTERCKFSSNPCESANDSCPQNTTCIVVTGYVLLKNESDQICGKYEEKEGVPLTCEYLKPSYEEIKCATDLDLKTKYSKPSSYLGTWSYARDRK